MIWVQDIFGLMDVYPVNNFTWQIKNRASLVDLLLCLLCQPVQILEGLLYACETHQYTQRKAAEFGSSQGWSNACSWSGQG